MNIPIMYDPFSSRPVRISSIRFIFNFNKVIKQRDNASVCPWDAKDYITSAFRARHILGLVYHPDEKQFGL